MSEESDNSDSSDKKELEPLDQSWKNNYSLEEMKQRAQELTGVNPIEMNSLAAQGYSLRYRKFLSGIVSGLDPVEAAKGAGYKDPEEAYKQLTQKKTEQHLESILEKYHLDLDSLIADLAWGLKKSKEGGKFLIGRDGTVNQIPDLESHHRYIMTALKLKAMIYGKKDISTNVNIKNYVNFFQGIGENGAREFLVRLRELRTLRESSL